MVCRSTTRIVAFILLALVATDPFFQQLISYSVRFVPSINLTVSINETARLASSAEQYPYLLSSSSLDTLSGVISAGTYANGLTARVPPDCPSGHCVWEPYHAFSLCSKCEDITKSVTTIGSSPQAYLNQSIAQILSTLNATYMNDLKLSGDDSYDISKIYKNGTGFWTLKMPTARNYQSVLLSDSPDGGPLDTIDVFIPSHFYPWSFGSSNSPPSLWAIITEEVTTLRNITSMTTWTEPQVVAGIANPLMALSSIVVDESGTAAEILECALTLCGHEYRTFVEAGKLTSYPLSTSHGSIDLVHGSDVYIGPIRVNLTINSTRYSVPMDLMGLENMFSALSNAVLGTITQNLTQGTNFHQGKSGMVFDHASSVYALTLSSLEIASIADQGNFSKVLENIASSLNNYLQRYATDQIPGQVLIQETYVHVRWAWLVLPLMLVIVGILTLLQTIWQTKQQNAVMWKSSILPLLYRGSVQLSSTVDSKTVLPQSGLSTVAAMYEDAKGVRVHLVREGEMGEWRLKETR